MVFIKIILGIILVTIFNNIIYKVTGFNPFYKGKKKQRLDERQQRIAIETLAHTFFYFFYIEFIYFISKTIGVFNLNENYSTEFIEFGHVLILGFLLIINYLVIRKDYTFN